MISNIQRFSLHDGTGIRTTVFLKGRPLHCPWCANPETQDYKQELMPHRNNCTQCGHCIANCPAHALTLTDKTIQVSGKHCTLCGTCEKLCPNRVPRISGQELSASEIIDIVLKDKVFYDASGGGLTLSGGEPFFQPEFTLELLVLAKKQGLLTCIETCLCCPFTSIEKALPYLDEIYFDIKHVNEAKHQLATGVGNRQILSNIQQLLDLRPDAKPRIPVIPNFNDMETDIREICDTLHTIGISSVELMWYHNLGAPKYHALSRIYDYEQITIFTEETKQHIAELYNAEGITLINHETT